MKAIIWILALLTITGSALAIPQVGQTGIDTTYNSEYIVCRADSETAWVAHNENGGDQYNAQQDCEDLGYSGYDLYGGNCGTVCGYCGNQGEEHYDGAGLRGSYLAYTVHWRCTNYVGNGNEVPEFGLIGAAIAIIGIAGFLIFRRK